MRVNANGHVRRSAAEWGAIVGRFRQSGLGIAEFCAREGVAVHRFEQWYRRSRRAETPKGPLIALPPLAATVGPWAVEVELPSGVRLRLRG